MTDDRTKVQRLEAIGIAEDRIAEVLHLTLQRTRRLMQNPPETLSQAARDEIFYADIDDSPRSGWSTRLASQYRTTINRVISARGKRTKTCTTPEATELKQYVEALGLHEACKQLGCSVAYARETIGYRRGADPALVKELLQKKLTYEAIGTIIGRDAGYVRQFAYRHGLTSRVNARQRTDWPDILDYASKTTVSEAARKYNVTRANIYYHIRKKEAENDNIHNYD